MTRQSRDISVNTNGPVRIRTAIVHGMTAVVVDMQVDVAFAASPSFTIVGADHIAAYVRECGVRVRSAIRAAGFTFPRARIAVSFAGAEVSRIERAALDLPIAIGVLAAQGVVPAQAAANVVLFGELSLEGFLQPLRGVLAIARATASCVPGSMLFVSPANAREAAAVEDMHVVVTDGLLNAVTAILEPAQMTRLTGTPAPSVESASDDLDLADVEGAVAAKRALEMAAAGGHHLLLIGRPGSGKTMLARRLPALLPPLSFEESLEITTIHSVAGLLQPGSGLLSARPFRAPHHTVSEISLSGGGASPRPGEISLAHHGVLFLDELSEFSRRGLGVLRSAIRDGVVHVGHGGNATEFPARVLYVAAMNPCPCGYRGDPRSICRCTESQVHGYWRHVASIRDCFDIAVDLSRPQLVTRSQQTTPTSSAMVRARVVAARERRRLRGSGETLGPAVYVNAEQLRSFCSPDMARELDLEYGNMGASGHARVLRVARTIADLEGIDDVHLEHVAEALSYALRKV